MKRALGLFFAAGVLGLVTFVGCGDDGLGTGGDMNVGDLSASTMDLAGKDFASNGTGGSDLAGRDFAGVACGAMTCGTGQACCIVPSGTSVTTMCVTGSSCGDGGIPASCDGPEDCNGGTPNCCADISLGGMAVSGMASCTATCAGSATQSAGGGMVTSKLCHNSADCTGYTGTAPVLGNTNFDRCCGNAALPIKFCAPGLITAVSNQITCD